MATPTTNTGGVIVNAPVQSAVAGVLQGLYEVTTDQKGPVGTRKELGDGRVFRYAYFAAAVGPGKLVAPDYTSQIGADGAATAVVNSAGTAADTAAGATTVYLKDTDVYTTANSDGVFAGGYFHTCNGAGEGHLLRIRDSKYTASSSVLKLELYDGLPILLASEAEVAVTGNPYNYLDINDNADDIWPVGVTMVDMAAGEYGWVQTWGPATVLCDGTISAGQVLAVSDGVDGAVHELGGGATLASESDIEFQAITTEPIVGFAISAGTNASYMPVYLQLAP